MFVLPSTGSRRPSRICRAANSSFQAWNGGSQWAITPVEKVFAHGQVASTIAAANSASSGSAQRQGTRGGSGSGA